VQWQQNQQNQQIVTRVQPSAPAAPSLEAKQQGAQAPASPTISSAAQTVTVQSNAVQLETRSQDQAQNLPPVSDGLFDKETVSPVGKAKPAESANAPAPHGASGTVPLNGRNVTQLSTLAVVPRWAINSAGVLQRSFDQGNSWTDVDVNANLLPSSAGMTKLALANNMRAVQKDSDKKAMPAPLSVPVFRAVFASGTDVWAGGSNGGLFHSADAGNHWTKIVPVSSGLSLTDDVIAVEFTDTLHGKVTTATGDLWTTSDAGLTWLKRKG